jgi:peptidoglycan hydrolase-like protein with peptidoglycan-binding domain
MRAGRSIGWLPRRTLALAAAATLALSGLLAVSGGSVARAASDGGTSAPASLPRPAAQPSALQVQRRLVALRYLPPSAVTGRWDYRTSQAVTAFQAWEGLTRDGSVGPRTLAALQAARPPQPAQATVGRSIEVYRAKGVTLLIQGRQVVLAIHSSTGRLGYTTPAGRFRVFRKELASWSNPYSVWLPYASYFNGGIAFHAYADVPTYPASHGCIRVSAPEAPILYAFAVIGTPVTVY